MTNKFVLLNYVKTYKKLFYSNKISVVSDIDMFIQEKTKINLY